MSLIFKTTVTFGIDFKEWNKFMKLKFEGRIIENVEFRDEKSEVFSENLKTLQFFMLEI